MSSYIDLEVSVRLEYNPSCCGSVDEYNYKEQISEEIEKKIKEGVLDLISDYYRNDLLNGFNVEVKNKDEIKRQQYE